MGLSTKKTSQKTSQNTTLNTTPTNPTFVTQGIEGLASKIGDVFGSLDPSKLVAGSNRLLDQAYDGAGNLGRGLLTAPQTAARGIGATLGGMGEAIGRARASLDPGKDGISPSAPMDLSVMMAGGPASKAAGMPGGRPMGADPLTAAGGNPYSAGGGVLSRVANTGATGYRGTTGRAASSLDDLGSFFNPYRDSVMKDYDYGAGLTRAENKLALAGDTTFGGSGGAIQTAMSEDAINRGRGALSASIYDRALAASADDANRRQAMELANMTSLNDASRYGAAAQEAALGRQAGAATSLAGVGATAGGEARADAATQAGLGTLQRDVQNQVNQAPIDTLMKQIAAWSGLPLELFKGANTTGTMTGKTVGKESGATLGTWLDFFKANAQAAAAGGG